MPGLRREEVAQLARVSRDFYTRPERDSIRGVSDSVLDAVASALQLDEAERAHLMDLSRPVGTRSGGPLGVRRSTGSVPACFTCVTAW